MKQLNITLKVIELAKEIAEKWRMEIYEGCWYQYTSLGPLDDKEETCLLLHSDREPTSVQKQLDAPKNDIFRGSYIPIPSISDCERKFTQLGWTIYRTIQHEQAIDHHELGDMWQVVVRRRWDENKKDWIEMMASTHHEALLSALLEVLKEVK
ncbi:unnamed protein product [marine sediment metagenome]|uniref:Phage ABA sandwich domain-containing protein n=1 Tax=marine sediment metagenome TaxID=412755 RepID=X0VMR0_9ZZZZ